MAKSADAFRTISEVAEWLETPAHVLRFWESKFTQVKPVKRAGGRRYYRPGDMELLGGIKQLLHEEGMTIKGVQKLLRERGVGHVAGLSIKRVNLDDGPEAPMAEAVEPEVETPTVVPFRPQSEPPRPAPAPPQAVPEPTPEPESPAISTEVEAGADHEGISEDLAEVAAPAAESLFDRAEAPAPEDHAASDPAPEAPAPAAASEAPAPAAEETPQEAARPRLVDVPADPADDAFAPAPGLLELVTRRTAPLDAEAAARVGQLVDSLQAWARKGTNT